MTVSNQGAARAGRHALLGCAWLAFAWLIARTAWVSDDAFISLRTAANWLGGYGLTWNVGERVQTFTHPLWLFALTAAHALSGEPFYSTLYLSLAVSCAAIALLLFAAPGGLTEKLLGVGVLSFSRAFVDFSSSGLENPLTHLLIAAFASVYFAKPASPKRSAWLCATAGLCALNRLDTVLLFLPALAADVVSQRSVRAVARLGWAAAPVALWELFSLVYYGFPFPNTAYAKLTQGKDMAGHRVLDGLAYLADSLAHDPLTLCAIAGCTAIALRRRDAQRLWLLAGAGSYVAYTVGIGGDFMSGRFFSAPLFLSMCCLATSDWLQSGAARAAATALALALSLLGSTPPPFTGADYGAREVKNPATQSLIHNERAMFFPISSLRNASTMNPGRSDHPWSRGGLSDKAAAERDPNERVRVVDAIGYVGYYAGPGVHLVDHWALADALIARLPAVFGGFGHYPRVIPKGYVETLRSGRNQIADRKLAAYYDQLALVLRGPIWSARRLRAIWKLNTGAYAELLDAYAYLRAPRFAPRLRLHNPTDYPCVMTYVWSDSQLSNYVIDDASTAGKAYEVQWQISPEGARLLSPPAQQISSLPKLQERGLLSISVAFANSQREPVRAIYEIRYPYSIVGDQLVIQRHGWSTFNGAFPNGAWHDANIDPVLEVLE